MQLKLAKKGQGIAIDFLFAALVFVLVLNTAITIVDSNYRSISNKDILNRLNAKTAHSLDVLVRTTGQPSDWEQKGVDDAEIIGLAKRDRTLDSEKLSKFLEWGSIYGSEDYNKTRVLLALIGFDYHFKVSDSSGNLLGQTAQPPDNRWDEMIAVNIKRIVNLNGDEAIARLTIYYPR